MRSWKFNHIDFSTYPFYGGDDLGVFWRPESTLIKIWAPTAKQVEFRLYNDGTTGQAFYKTNLLPQRDGVWSAALKGDFQGKYYTLKVNDGGWLEEVPDIYARSVGLNGKRGMIYDPLKTDPEGWKDDQGPVCKNFTDAVIYETHVRDFTIAEPSGISQRGRYLGFTEKETQSPEGMTTGLAHLKELGITHVHLLPVSDFATVDEAKPAEKYNWGYDPMHFNALEGSYSQVPEDGRVRISEFKKLVKALHDNGIGVILDVVYNHTYYTKESVFNQTVPGYFYRQKPDGTFANASGCGNEVASERSMVRKYIIDSLMYWTREFHIDGFRFDLMGIMDIQTMKEAQAELDRIRPGIVLYGEGWTADTSPMPETQRAVKANLSQLKGIAGFNDTFRDALKGSHGKKKSKGFVSGLSLREEEVKFGIVGATHHPQIVYDYIDSASHGWASDPDQCINYVSCHDNYTLWDKLKMSRPDVSDEKLKRMVKLAGALVLTSQGVPFLHGGVEFCRTKGGNGNSYKSPDSVNKMDWSRKAEHVDVFEYFKNLIMLRKEHPAFRMTRADQIRKSIHFCMDYKTGLVSYCIDTMETGDSWKQMLVIFNANEKSVSVPLPDGEYELIATGDKIHHHGTGKFVTGETEVEPVSMTLLRLV